jgi:uracil-DNA glycosylase
VEEDEAGEPFVGPSGRLLRKTLATVGFEPDKLAYFNTVSCYPARTPTDEEMSACLGNLIAQILVIQPRYVLVAGSVALRGLGRRDRITDARGRPWKRELNDGGHRTYFPVWHPAAILRNRTLYAGWRRDLELFRELVVDD